jgi:hypothetical protein
MTSAPKLDLGVEDTTEADWKLLRNPDEKPEEKAAEPAPEAAPEAPAEPAAQETPAAEPDKEQPRDDKGKFDKPVPLAALKEEREKRQELQREIERERQERLAEREELTRKLALIQQRLEKPAEPIKSTDEDPVGALKRTEAEVARLQQAEQQRQMMTQFSAAVNQSVQQFRSQATDYDDAYKFLRESRINELKAIGYTDELAVQQLNTDEFNLAAQALQQRQNPAQAVYNLAKARGFARPAQTQAAEPAARATATDDARLDTIAKGQQAAKSLGNAGGSPPESMSLQRVLEMDEKQLANLSRDELRKLFG